MGKILPGGFLTGGLFFSGVIDHRGILAGVFFLGSQWPGGYYPGVVGGGLLVYYRHFMMGLKRAQRLKCFTIAIVRKYRKWNNSLEQVVSHLVAAMV